VYVFNQNGTYSWQWYDDPENGIWSTRGSTLNLTYDGGIWNPSFTLSGGALYIDGDGPYRQSSTFTPSTAPAIVTPSQSAAPVADATRTAIVNAARRYLGAAYVYGAQQPPTRFDCSGLVGQAYKDATNVVIPRSSSQIWARGQPVARNQVQPGDIVVFDMTGRNSTPTHVAIYVDASTIIHACDTNTGVITSRLSDASWSQKVMGYRTFVGVSIVPSRSSARQIPVSDFPVELTSTLQSGSQPVPVLVGTALSFTVINNTGFPGDFDIYFYKAGTARNSGESEMFRIWNGAERESKVFLCKDSGEYHLEIVSRAENKTLYEQSYTILE
jgi:cell wall-associated NlpC family hydrolase